jgi:hypothetical protein
MVKKFEPISTNIPPNAFDYIVVMDIDENDWKIFSSEQKFALETAANDLTEKLIEMSDSEGEGGLALDEYNHLHKMGFEPRNPEFLWVRQSNGLSIYDETRLEVVGRVQFRAIDMHDPINLYRFIRGAVYSREEYLRVLVVGMNEKNVKTLAKELFEIEGIQSCISLQYCPKTDIVRKYRYNA